MSPGRYELPSKSHLLLIHCQDGNEGIIQVIREAMAHWQPLWIVLEGHALALEKPLKAMSQSESGLRVLAPKSIHGKKSAVVHALDLANKKHFTHALVMDATGRHPAVRIRDFIAASFQHPGSMVLGLPTFSASNAPLAAWARLAGDATCSLMTLFAGIAGASLGFNLFPIGPLQAELTRSRLAGSGDFDFEMPILCLWAGVPFSRVPFQVRPLAGQLQSATSPVAWRFLKMLIRLALRWLWNLPKFPRWGKKLPPSSFES